MLRPLWLGRLPQGAQAILASQDQSQLDKHATLADAIVATFSLRTQVAETSVQITPSASNAVALDALFQQLTLVTTRLAEMTTTIAEVASNPRNRGRSQSRGRHNYRDRSRSRPSNKDGVCWYHVRFADNAKRCNQPCTYIQGNGQGRR